MSSVFIIGLRGIPGVQGGIETHVENLAPLLVNHGIQVTILARKGFQPRLSEYQGVKIKTLWSPKSKFLEAIVHTFFGIMYATVKRPDILHIHAIGPSILTPIARIVGLKVVMTHHGPDYDRQKWGNLAKFILRLGEKLGTKFSNQVIVISNTINRLIYKNIRLMES
jgi:glycosyltransferase involved in cell wall biosynthesis